MESWASFFDFLKTEKMCNVCTIMLAAVSRQDLYYVSVNDSFGFGQKQETGPRHPALTKKGRGEGGAGPLHGRVKYLYLGTATRPPTIQGVHYSTNEFDAKVATCRKELHLAGPERYGPSNKTPGD